MADDEGPDDDGSGDIAPEDMEDLGELGDGDDEGDGPDGDEDGEGKDKPWKPPTKSQWERAQRRLKRYADERRAGKGGADVDHKLRDQLRGGKDGEDGEGKDGAAEAAVWRSRAAAADASAQLTAAGFSGSAAQARRLTRLIDLDGAKPDRDGRFDFTDDIEDLKEDYPELFGGRGTRRNERRQHTAPNRTEPTKKSATDRTSDRLLKEAGYR